MITVRIPWTQQPPAGTPVIQDIFGRFEFGVWNLNGSLKNCVPVSEAGDLEWPANGVHAYATRNKIGRGISFDNSSSEASAATFTTGAPFDGFWRRGMFTAGNGMTFVWVGRLEEAKVTNAVQVFAEMSEVGRGLAIGYRQTSSKVVFCDGSGELASNSTYTRGTDLVVVSKWSSSRRALWINGILEGDEAGSGIIGGISDDPGLGNKEGTTSFAESDEDEFGGIISMFAAARSNVPDELCLSLSANPWQIFEPRTIKIPYSDATGGPPVDVWLSQHLIDFGGPP